MDSRQQHITEDESMPNRRQSLIARVKEELKQGYWITQPKNVSIYTDNQFWGYLDLKPFTIDLLRSIISDTRLDAGSFIDRYRDYKGFESTPILNLLTKDFDYHIQLLITITKPEEVSAYFIFSIKNGEISYKSKADNVTNPFFGVLPAKEFLEIILEVLDESKLNEEIDPSNKKQSLINKVKEELNKETIIAHSTILSVKHEDVSYYFTILDHQNLPFIQQLTADTALPGEEFLLKYWDLFQQRPKTLAKPYSIEWPWWVEGIHSWMNFHMEDGKLSYGETGSSLNVFYTTLPAKETLEIMWDAHNRLNNINESVEAMSKEADFRSTRLREKIKQEIRKEGQVYNRRISIHARGIYGITGIINTENNPQLIDEVVHDTKLSPSDFFTKYRDVIKYDKVGGAEYNTFSEVMDVCSGYWLTLGFYLNDDTLDSLWFIWEEGNAEYAPFNNRIKSFYTALPAEEMFDFCIQEIKETSASMNESESKPKRDRKTELREKIKKELKAEHPEPSKVLIVQTDGRKGMVWMDSKSLREKYQTIKDAKLGAEEFLDKHTDNNFTLERGHLSRPERAIFFKSMKNNGYKALYHVFLGGTISEYIIFRIEDGKFHLDKIESENPFYSIIPAEELFDLMFEVAEERSQLQESEKKEGEQANSKLQKLRERVHKELSKVDGVTIAAKIEVYSRMWIYLGETTAKRFRNNIGTIIEASRLSGDEFTEQYGPVERRANDFYYATKTNLQKFPVTDQFKLYIRLYLEPDFLNQQVSFIIDNGKVSYSDSQNKSTNALYYALPPEEMLEILASRMETKKLHEEAPVRNGLKEGVTPSNKRRLVGEGDQNREVGWRKKELTDKVRKELELAKEKSNGRVNLFPGNITVRSGQMSGQIGYGAGRFNVIKTALADSRLIADEFKDYIIVKTTRADLDNKEKLLDSIRENGCVIYFDMCIGNLDGYIIFECRDGKLLYGKDVTSNLLFVALPPKDMFNLTIDVMLNGNNQLSKVPLLEQENPDRKEKLRERVKKELKKQEISFTNNMSVWVDGQSETGVIPLTDINQDGIKAIFNESSLTPSDFIKKFGDQIMVPSPFHHKDDLVDVIKSEGYYLLLSLFIGHHVSDNSVWLYFKSENGKISYGNTNYVYSLFTALPAEEMFDLCVEVMKEQEVAE